ncbi:KICSTOR complex protein szt2 [Chytriomyces hyalinus]|nr:KICSTOR complex protein szt2 [Chytriomyces hyalinus]
MDNCEIINFGEFAFFYNSVQSRSNTPFEISVGNGTALISIFVVNSKRNICQTFSHPSFGIDRSHETLWERNAHSFLRDHASELRIGDFDRCIHDDSNYAMAVEIWHYGALNSDVLMDYVFKSFCNTISDYSTESSVRSLSETLRSNSSSQLPQLEISKVVVGEPFKIHSSLNVFFDQTMTHLALSAELKNAAVQELCSPIRLPRCIADEIALDTRDLLTEISASFNPVLVERAQLPSGEPSLTLYSAKGSSSEESFQNRQILLVVGIPELSELYGCTAEEKKTPKSTTSSGTRTPTSTMHDMESSFTGAAHKNSISSRAGVSQNPFDSRKSVADGVQVYPRNLMLSGKELCTRSGFLMMLIDQSQISTATYNLNQAAYETIFNHLLQILSWNNIRMQFLESGRRGDSFGITPREKLDNLSVSAGIEHASSYTGVGGLGHAAMSHFVANGMSESTHADKLKRLYNINENSLQRSAVAFLDSYVRNLSLDGRSNHSPAEQWAEGMDTPRASLVQATTGPSDGRKLSTADLAALLRSIRLFFVHYPIFFSELRSSMFKDDVTPPHNEDFSNASTPIQQWFKETLVKFSAEYSKYLATFGFEPFKTPSSQTGDWEKPPTFYISKSASVEIDAVYLKKRLDSGILFVQIGVEGVCIVVNLFMLRLPSDQMSPVYEEKRYAADSDADASFKLDCAKNKEALHVHSFSYDFHIRYFQHILDNQQNCIIDILDVMKVFEKYNSDRFVYARSRILGGECVSDDPAPSISLFQYILKNPTQYGFKSIMHNGHPTACFLTSEFQDFAKTASKSQFKSTGLSYTVVVYVSREQAAEGAPGSSETSLQLRYFLLIVDRENAFPVQGLEVKNQSFVKKSHQEKLKEYLAGGCYFGDVAKFAEKKILMLMEQATRYYDRDSLWRQLHVNQHPIPLAGDFADANETAYEWSKMFLEKIARNSRTLLLIDPSLVNVFGDASLPWLDIIKFLETTYHMTARRIFEEPSVGRQHLILFNPRDSDYMIHIMYWQVGPTGLPIYSMDDRGTDAGNHNHPGDSSGVSTPGLFSDDEVKLSIKDRLRVLEENVGVELARAGQYQVDVMLVSRESVAHDGEYVQCNEIVNAICSWLWSKQREKCGIGK